MTLTIVKKRVRSLTDSDRNRLTQLTISERSHMLAVLEDNPNHARCWLATERDIIGWSLIRWFEPRLKRGFDAYINVHVDSDFRKQGLGKRLITAAMAYAEENRLSYCVYGINREQQSLYRSVKIAGDRIVTFDFPRTYWEHYRFSKRLCWIPAS